MRATPWVVGTALTLAGAAGAWLAWAASSPLGLRLDRWEAAELLSVDDPQRAAVPKALKVMTWNIAFGGGVEGQPTGLYSREHVLAQLQAIAEGIRRVQPDVVLMQEVDREARRSGGVDQFHWLLEHAGLSYGCYVDTWDVRYLPHPGWRPSGHLGRVRSGQAILSRFPIRSCRREPLPQPPEAPWWYRPFFLHRALQWAEVDLGDGSPLMVGNVHLEAFWQQNRETQARMLAERLATGNPKARWVVGGDFNAVPAEAPRKRDFPDEPETDFTTDRTLQVVRSVPGLREVFLDDAPDAPVEASWTFPASAPNRRLDYLFYRGFASSTQRAVPRLPASDHRPLEAALWMSSPDPEAAGPEGAP